MTLKPILLYEKKGRPITGPHGIEVLARREGSKILHHEHFTVRPAPIFHDVELGIYIVLIEFEAHPPQPQPSFGTRMDRLKLRALEVKHT